MVSIKKFSGNQRKKSWFPGKASELQGLRSIGNQYSLFLIELKNIENIDCTHVYKVYNFYIYRTNEKNEILVSMIAVERKR